MLGGWGGGAGIWRLIVEARCAKVFPRPCRIFVFLYIRVLNYSEDFAGEETYLKLVATKLEIYNYGKIILPSDYVL